MANRLDDIFGKKLGNRQFSPKDSDWAAMESMIDAEFGSPPSTSSMSINWMFSSLFIVLIGVSTLTALNERSISKKLISKSTTESQTIESSKSTNSIPTSSETNAVLELTAPSPAITTSADNTDESTNTILSSTTNKSAIKTSQNTSTALSNSEKNNAKQSDGSVAKDYSNTNYSNDPIEKNLAVSSTIPAEEVSNNSRDNEVIGSANTKDELDENKNNSVALTGLGITSSTASTTNNSKDLLNTSSDNKSPESSKASNRLTSTSQKSISGNEDDKTYFADEDAKYKASEAAYLAKGNMNTVLPENNNLFLSSSTIRSLGEIKKSDLLKTSTYSDPTTLHKTKTNKGLRNFPLQFSIAAFGEVSLITKKITGDNEFSSLVVTRNQEENNMISFGGGIELQAKYKGFGFNTGFYLSKWGEDIQYEEKYTSEWEVNNIVVSDTLWIEDIFFTYDSLLSPGDSAWIVFIVDSSFITVVDTVLLSTVSDSSEVLSPIGLANKNGKTTISYWEIPLYFSYQFDMGDFYLTPGVGVTFGFLKITRGYYMAKDENSLIPIDTDYAVIRRTIINGQLNLGVGYHLNDNFSIELTPAFKFNLNNIFEDSGIDQRYKVISLQFRLRYYF